MHHYYPEIFKYFTLSLFFLSSLPLTSEDLDKNMECKSGDPEVFFIKPSNNFVSDSGLVELEFGLTNFNILPAGTIGCDAGHHHLLINTPLPDLKRPIPSDKNHIHYGKGQTSATIELPPGRHSLRLILGDFAHIPHEDPIYSEELIIIVK